MRLYKFNEYICVAIEIQSNYKCSRFISISNLIYSEGNAFEQLILKNTKSLYTYHAIIVLLKLGFWFSIESFIQLRVLNGFYVSGLSVSCISFLYQEDLKEFYSCSREARKLLFKFFREAIKINIYIHFSGILRWRKRKPVIWN